MRRLSAFCAAVLASPVLLAPLASPAQAATVFTWVGPDGGSWSTAANWQGGAVPTGTGDLVLHGSSTDDLLDRSFTASSASLDGGTVTSSLALAGDLSAGSSSTLAGSLALSVAGYGFTTDDAATVLNVASAVSGTVSTNHGSPGTVRFTGTSTYSGRYAQYGTGTTSIEGTFPAHVDLTGGTLKVSGSAGIIDVNGGEVDLLGGSATSLSGDDGSVRGHVYLDGGTHPASGITLGKTANLSGQHLTDEFDGAGPTPPETVIVDQPGTARGGYFSGSYQGQPIAGGAYLTYCGGDGNDVAIVNTVPGDCPPPPTVALDLDRTTVELGQVPHATVTVVGVGSSSYQLTVDGHVVSSGDVVNGTAEVDLIGLSIAGHAVHLDVFGDTAGTADQALTVTAPHCDATWSGPDSGAWSVSGNWAEGHVPADPVGTLCLSGVSRNDLPSLTADRVVTLDNGSVSQNFLTVKDVLVGSGSFTFAANVQHVEGATATVPYEGVLTYDDVVSGIGLAVHGSGKVRLAGTDPNNLEGLTVLEAVTVELAKTHDVLAVNGTLSLSSAAAHVLVTNADQAAALTGTAGTMDFGLRATAVDQLTLTDTAPDLSALDVRFPSASQAGTVTHLLLAVPGSGQAVPFRNANQGQAFDLNDHSWFVTYCGGDGNDVALLYGPGACLGGPGGPGGGGEKLNTSTSLSASPTSSTVGSPVTLTASVGGSATGSVQFFADNAFLGSSNLISGSATLTVSTLTVGDHDLEADYLGDSGHNTSNDQITFTVQPLPCDYTWAGADGGSWSVAGNWAGGTAPTGSVGSVCLTGTSANDVVGLTVADLEIRGATTLSGNSLTLPGKLVHIADATATISNDLVWNDATLTLGSNAFLVLSGSISGTTVHVRGSGDLQLLGSKANTFTGRLDAQQIVTVELGKVGAASIPHGIEVGGDFDPVGAHVIWLEDNQLASGPLTGEDDTAYQYVAVAGSGLVNLDGHSDTVHRLEMNMGHVTSGTGTLTVTGRISNNNTSGDISGTLNLPAGTHNITRGSQDNKLDLNAVVVGSGELVDRPENGNYSIFDVNASSPAWTGTLTESGGNGMLNGVTLGASLHLKDGYLQVHGHSGVASVTSDSGTFWFDEAPTTTSDLTVTGAVDVSHAALSLNTTSGDTYTAGERVLVHVGGTVRSAPFTNYVQGQGILLGGTTARYLSYCGGDGNDIALTDAASSCDVLTLPAGTVVYARHSAHPKPGASDDVWARTPAGDALLEANASQPRLSADGHLLVFRRGTELDGYGDAIVVRDLRTGAERTLATSSYSMTGFDLSPDGTTVLYDGGCQLTRVAVSTTASLAADPNQCQDRAPRYNATGTRVAVQVDGAGIALLQPDGTGRTLLAGTKAGDLTPSWSPDGATIAFLRPQAGTPSRVDVWTVPAAGGTPTRLTTLLDSDSLTGTLPWSADGSAVLAAGKVYGLAGLWWVPVAGGLPRYLGTVSGNAPAFVGASFGSVPAPPATATTATLTRVGGSPSGTVMVVTFQVSSATGTPRGTATLTDDHDGALGTASLDSAGIATFTVTKALAVTDHTITAVFVANPAFGTSSAHQSFGVAPGGFLQRKPQAVPQASRFDPGARTAWVAVHCVSRAACSGVVSIRLLNGTLLTSSAYSLKAGTAVLLPLKLSPAALAKLGRGITGLVITSQRGTATTTVRTAVKRAAVVTVKAHR